MSDMVAIGKNSLRFTPKWAMVVKNSTAARQVYDPLDIEWFHGVPIPLRDKEQWTGGCYVGRVRIAFPVDEAGGPLGVSDASRTVRLCDAVGTFITTDRRIIGLLGAGVLLGRQMNRSQDLAFTLDFADAVSARPVLKRKLLSGATVIGAEIDVFGANQGLVELVPTRGLKNPWDPDKRSVWGRDVGLACWQKIVEAAGGSAKSTMLEEVNFALPS